MIRHNQFTRTSALGFLGWRPSVVRAMVAISALALLSVACQPVMSVNEDLGSAESPVVESVSASSAITESLGTAEMPVLTPAPDKIEPAGDETSVEPDTVEAADVEKVAEGLATYRAQYCGICHVLEPAGTTGRFGPSHDDAAAKALKRLQDPRYSGSAQTVEEYLYESLVKPQAYIVEGYVGSSHSMPSYSHLDEEELRSLVALLLAQK